MLDILVTLALVLLAVGFASHLIAKFLRLY